ncbi:hypothetical protein FOL47_000946 [Perkinsus chesapeaki]|uniref:Uncharacterized protein n=1 Tax=Perkinsus chesapeaki TaxID=330153 RepID=A0A7J6MKG5_PERCH|nr:hypothetical protein FOL47_000946 [Perkinsus chesapeaki]
MAPSAAPLDAISGLLSTDPMTAAVIFMEETKSSKLPRASMLNLGRNEVPLDEAPGRSGGWSGLCVSKGAEKISNSPRWSPVDLRKAMAKAMMQGVLANRLKQQQSFAAITVGAVHGLEPTFPCHRRRIRFTWYSEHLLGFVPGMSSWEVDYELDPKQPSLWRPEDSYSFPLLVHLPRLANRNGLRLLLDAVVSDGEAHGRDGSLTNVSVGFSGTVRDSTLSLKISTKPSAEQLQSICLLPADLGYICPLYFARIALLYRLYNLIITQTGKSNSAARGAALSEKGVDTASPLVDPVLASFPKLMDDGISRRNFLKAWRKEVDEMPRDQQADDMSLLRLLQALCQRFWLNKGRAIDVSSQKKVAFSGEVLSAASNKTVNANAVQWPWKTRGPAHVPPAGREKTVEDFRAAQSAWLWKEMEASGWPQQESFKPMHSEEFTYEEHGMFSGSKSDASSSKFTNTSEGASSDRQVIGPEISDLEALYFVDELLWHTEIQDLFLGRQSFARLCESMGSDDIVDVVSRCLSLIVGSLEGSDVEQGQALRADTLMALQYIAFGCSLAEDSPCDTLIPLMRSASELFYHEGVLRCMVVLVDRLLDLSFASSKKREAENLSHTTQKAELLLARELRCCFNVIFVCLIFNMNRLDFALECITGSPSPGAQRMPSEEDEDNDEQVEEERSLLSILTDASRWALDLRELPVRKLLLCDLFLWKSLLNAPDHWLYLMTPNTPDMDMRPCRRSLRGAPGGYHTECSALLGQFPASEPALKDFQALVVLCLHENFILSEHGCRRPQPVKEALDLIHAYQDKFLCSYAFHAAEEEFLRRNTRPLAEIYTRFLSFKARGLVNYRVGLIRKAGDDESRFSIQQLVKHLIPNWEDRVSWCDGPRVPIDRNMKAVPWGAEKSRGRTEAGSSSGETDDDAPSVASSDASSEASLDPEVMEAGFRLLDQVADENGDDREAASGEDGAVEALVMEGDSENDSGVTNDRGLRMSVGDAKSMFEGITRWIPSEMHEDALDAVCNEDATSPEARKETGEKAVAADDQKDSEVRGEDELRERFMLYIVPKLDSLFSTLQQLCLSASNNPSEYPCSIDLSVERQLLSLQQVQDEGATDGCSAAHHPENVTIEEMMLADGATLANGCLRHVPLQGQEMQRHSDIITACITGMVLCLLKRCRQVSLQLFQAIIDFFCKNNGALVMLKVLNGLNEASVRPYTVPPVLPCLRCSEKAPRFPRKSSSETTVTETLQSSMPCPTAESYLRSASILYIICRDCPERVRKILVQFRSFTGLVRMFRTPNRQIQRLGYKLFKKQVRFFPKKLRTNAMSAISTTYNILMTSPVDDWLLSSPLHAENHRDEGLILDFTSGTTDYAPSVNELQKCNSFPEGIIPCTARSSAGSKLNRPSVTGSLVSEERSKAMADYQKLLDLVDWGDAECVEAFLQATGMSPKECFYGYPTLESWLGECVLKHEDGSVVDVTDVALMAASSGLRLLLVLFSPFIFASYTLEPPSDLVNVLAGTLNTNAISTGGNMPIIARPFGFNHWSIVTDTSREERGFSPSSVDFYGIICTHKPSFWIGDYGYFMLLPRVHTHASSFIPNSFASLFRPDQATYKPYYFRTTLANSQSTAGQGYIITEMTPTEHAAVLRFQFVSKDDRIVLIRGVNLTLHSQKDDPSKLVFDTTANSGGVPDNFRMFIVIDAMPSPQPDIKQRSYDEAFELNFGSSKNSGEFVELRIATSFISEEQAWINLENEAPRSYSFDTIKEAGKSIWDERLTSVKFDRGVNGYTFQRTFYTNYYRSLLFPRLLTETNASNVDVHYSPYTGNIHDGELATDSGFWDSYNTVYLWLDIAAPDMLSRILKGWVSAYKEAKWLPTWPSPGERQSMIGTMGDVVFAWAIVADKVNSQMKSVMYEAIRLDAFGDSSEISPYGRDCGVKEYKEKVCVTAEVWYVGYLVCGDCVSRVLYNMVADAAIADAAEKMGEHEDAAALRERVNRAVDANWNADLELFGPRKETGEWVSISNKTWTVKGYTEGGALQYRFYLPFNVPRLAELYGGKDKLCRRIHEHFSTKELPLFEPLDGWSVSHEQAELSLISHSFGQYAHNNQPSHHVLGVALTAGCETTADENMRKVLEELYNPDGWAGDEDNGEMSAWFLLNAIGIFMVDFGKDELLLFSPMGQEEKLGKLLSGLPDAQTNFQRTKCPI